MFEKNKNMIAGGVIFVLSLIYFILSFQIQLTNIDKLVGSRLFPQICGIALMGFSALLIGDNILKNRRGQKVVQLDDDGFEETNDGTRPDYLRTGLVLASFTLYILLMDLLGFASATVLYLFSQMILLEEKGKRKRYWLYGLITVLATALIYFMFTRAFYLMLPKGILI